MCAKIKSKKASKNFRESITAILISHGINIDSSILEPCLNDIEFYFNETFRPRKSTPSYWSHLVGQYLAFYQELTGEKASFIPAQASALSKLDKILMNRYLSVKKDSVWDEETALRQHLVFYNEAIKLDFYRKSFCISMLYNNFDMIKSNLSDLRLKEKEMKKKIFGI